MKKFALTKTKNNIKKALSFKNGIIYSSIDDIVFFDESQIIRDIDGSRIFKLNENLIQICDKSKGYYYFRESIFRSNYNLVKGHKTDKLIAISVPVRVSRGIYKRDIAILKDDLISSDQDLLSGTDLNLITYSDDYFILGNTVLYDSYSISNSSLNWRFDFKSLGTFNSQSGLKKNYEVKQFIGILDNKIWIYTNAHSFVSLDIENGNLVDHINGIPRSNLSGNIDHYLQEDDHYVFFDCKYHLDEKRKKIVGISADRFFEIDLNNSEPVIKLFGHYNELKSIELVPADLLGDSVMVDDELYFIEFRARKFGIYNTTSHQITYISDRIEGEGQLKEIQIDSNKAFVHDSSNTLHIFEKE